MDLTSAKYLETSNLFPSPADATLESNNGLSKTSSMKNPFLDSFSDPFCKLHLKETSEFVKSFPVPNNGTETRGFSEISSQNGVPRRNLLSEAPPTPGRPIFSFSNTRNYSRKCFPSKWDDAEKWLVSGSSCNDSPSNNSNNYNSNNVALFKSIDSSKMYTKQCSGYKPHMGEVFAEKSRITEEKVSKVISNFQGPLVMDYHHNPAKAINGAALSASADVLLKDNEFVFGNSEPMQEKFLFGNNLQKSISHSTSQIMLQQQQQIEVQHRDIGTEMTPLGSSTTSRCPTPFKSTSPARHNTPANRSGPLGLTGPDDDITQLQDCHLAKLQTGTQFDSVMTNWSSWEEEEEDVSKSLRHFEMSGEFRKSVSESRNNNNNNNINNFVWEEEEKTKSCHRYQREEAKIQAWVNLQSAKAEAESRKLEVKIQKMRANMEEKLMKRMADVHRKAEEWRATAQFQHSEQIRKAGQLAREAMNNNRRNNKNSHFSSGHKSCGCFPCNK